MKKINSRLISPVVFFKRKPIIVALLAFSPCFAYAATAVPNAGTILQQVKPISPAVPSSTDTGLSIEKNGGFNLPESQPFTVKKLHISGNTLFTTDTLHDLVKDAEGKDLSLSQLNKVIAKITDYYHQHGYSLARAIIPAQTITDGVVEIKILEARYGKVLLNNQSKVVDRLVAGSVSSLQAGNFIDQNELDHDLLLLSDIPGISTTAILKPGEYVGTSDLQIDAKQEAYAAGNISADNYGTQTTGRDRMSAVLEVIDPAHHGDVFTVSGLTSGKDMSYGQISYDSMLSGRGTHLGGSYSSLHYELGSDLRNLKGHGTADVVSLWLKQTLARSRNFNLYGQIEFDSKQLDDDIDVSSIRTKRHLNNSVASLTGDARDQFLGGAISAWSASLTNGRVKFDDGAAELTDAGSAKTQTSFSKLNVQLTRLQQFDQKNSLYLSLSGQWASTNLDSAEKMVAGGPTTVRAYDMSVLSGDIGYLGTVELRHDLSALQYGQLQAVAFVDSEHIQINKNPWGSDANSATLTGAGLGLNWTNSLQWSVKAYAAKPIGSLPALLSDQGKRTRFWVQLAKGF